MPYQNIINNFTKQLEHSNSQFKTLLPISMDVIQIVESEVGPGPKGSILSYQQKKNVKKNQNHQSLITMLTPITPTMIFQL